MDILRAIAEHILSSADIRIDGDRPWDVRVHDARAFRHVLLRGSLGLGEAYVEGWWSSGDLEETAVRLASARLEKVAELLPRGRLHELASMLRNQQTRTRAQRVAREHYDFGNDLFFAFLGAHKNYSCGYFQGASDLDQAQEAKMDLVCRKLDLRPGDHLLDIGGGWGELARHAAIHYGARVTSLNISEEQMRFAREHCRGLDVEVVRCDYRDVRGSFDKVAAIAMFTHVGYRNYRTFMEAVRGVLRPGGIFLVEGVWGNVSKRNIDAWIDRYIFPGAMIPSGAQTFRAIEGLFVAEDMHNFGPHYVKTLRAWRQRFQRSWPALRDRYGDRVYRRFDYFFSMIAGYFRARTLQHWHLVLTRPGAEQPACRIVDALPRRERASQLHEARPQAALTQSAVV